MKKLMLVLFVLMIVGCSTGPSDEACQLNWDAMEVERGSEALIAGMIMNTEHIPDSIGFVLKECLESGWDGWR